MEKEKKKTSGAKALTAVGIVLCIIFGFMLFCNCVIIIKGMFHPEMPPSVFGTTPMVVLSGSMSGDAKDHIEVGDLIFVNKADTKNLKTGDVIAFMQGKVVVTHRIVDIVENSAGERLFYTKGDANNVQDESPVSEKEIVGIYKWRIPALGNFAMFLQTPLGMVLFIGIPLIAFIGFDIIRNRRETRAEKEKTDMLEAEIIRLKKLAGEKEESYKAK